MMDAARRVLGPLFAPFYAQAIARRNARFNAGAGVVTLDRPVLSVGNLSTGGTGKTPMVHLLVTLLRECGHWPCVAMRGYGAPTGQGLASDEAIEHRARFPDLPLVAQPNRLEGLLALFATDAGERVDAVILDDGFQHRQIARDLDIVLIDATRPPFADRLLPTGNLREPVSSLERAGLIVITRSNAVQHGELDTLEIALRRVATSCPVVHATHQWASIERVTGDGPQEQSPASLDGMRLALACAIGNPQSFIAQAEVASGRAIEPALRYVLRDHDPYEPATIAKLLRLLHEHRPGALITTRKDWSKLSRVKPEAWPCPVLVPRVELHISPLHSPGWERVVLEVLQDHQRAHQEKNTPDA